VPTTTRKLEIKEFARRVERLCDFFIAQVRDEGQRDDSPNLKVLDELKEEAADIQFYYTETSESLKGLSDFMKGLDSVSEENSQKEL
jgi:hypothetical protein